MRLLTLLVGFALFLSAVRAQAEPFALGADISWVQQDEACGVRFFHNGQQVDPFTVLKDHGFNYIRLRIFVDPLAAIPGESESPYVTTNLARCNATANRAYCGADSTVRMAQRAKAAGMKVLLNFHYSDTWTDPGKQHLPMSWRGMTDAQIFARVRQYTRESLEKFREANALPDMVQVGNENVSQIIGYNINSANGAAVINAGIDGIKDVSSDILVMVHTINERNPIGWLTNLINRGVSADRIDVFGLSYYLRWHGTPDSLRRVADRFVSTTAFGNMKFSVVEYIANPPTTTGPDADPRTHHRRVNDIIYNMPNNRGFGTFIWEPFRWTDNNTGVALFDWRTGANSGLHSNSYLQDFPPMAEAYALNTTNINSSEQAGAKRMPAHNISITGNGIIHYNSSAPGTAAIYTMHGRVAGRFDMRAPGVYDPAKLFGASLSPGAYVIAVKPAGGKQFFSRAVVK